MKKSKLINLKEKLENRSKTPWACFETDGLSSEGLGVSMYWNPAFVMHLHKHGISGKDDQETLQMFFLYLASRVSDSLAGDTDAVNPDAMPNLTNEANTLVR